MSIFLKLNRKCWALLEKHFVKESIAKRAFFQSETGQRLVDGFLLWALTLIGAGFCYFTARSGVCSHFGSTKELVTSFLHLATGGLLLFGDIAPWVGFLWFPSGLASKQDFKLHLASAPEKVEGAPVLLPLTNQSNDTLASAVFFGGLSLFVVPIVLAYFIGAGSCFLGSWASLAIVINGMGSPWMEVDCQNQTLTRRWFFCGESWALDQQEMGECEGLIWGGFDKPNIGDNSVRFWLSLVQAGSKIVHIYCISERDKAKFHTPPAEAIELSEKLCLPLWLPTTMLPLSEILVEFLEKSRLQKLKIWGEHVPEVHPKTVTTPVEKASQPDPLEEMALE